MSKITDSAKGKECQVRIPGYCNWDKDRTSFAHLDGGGMGKKRPDYHGTYSCDSCHHIVAGLVRTEFTRDEIYIMHLEGVMRTQDILFEKGLLLEG